ncbi:MAG: glycosyltransferase [Phycisphaerae bacterium]|jgi:glycosyltransferase involved in cell wall biosynthesis
MTPSISVIISTHDRPDSLRRTVAAVLRQTLVPVELIVVNDGATDIADDVPASCAEAGLPLQVRRMDRPSLPASRNAGAALARGDVIMLLDDDVTMPDDYLARLAEMYRLDRRGVIGGIAGILTERQIPGLGHRLSMALVEASAANRWAPWRSVARYTALPPALAGRLDPARAMSGGAISLRRQVARRHHFNGALSGYALGEDTEFSFRVERQVPLFVARELVLWHELAPSGRPDNYRRGRTYVTHMTAIARDSVGGGAGTYLLLAYHLAGFMLLSAAWALTTWRRSELDLAAGIIDELAHQGWQWARRTLCGC